jgi:hypothetical protein
MVKTYSSPSSSPKKNNRRQVPSPQVLSNIMAYAKSLQVLKTGSGKSLFLSGN